MKQIDLFLREPVTFIFDLIRLNFGIAQQFTYVDVAVSTSDEFCIGINYSAVIERKTFGLDLVI